MTPGPTEAAVLALVTPLAGCACIFADQNAPRPVKPYITLRTLSSVGPENEHYFAVDNDGNQPVQSHRDFTIEVQAFGDGWNTLLGNLRQKLRWQTTGDTAYRAGIAIFDRGAITDIGALLDAAFWEPRGMFEIGVRALQASVDQVGIIETVNVTGTLTGSSTPILQATVTITTPEA